MTDRPHTVWRGRYLEMQKQSDWEFADRVDGIAAAVIVAVTGEGELLLVEQHRVPVGRTCLELPAGLVGDGVAEESVAEAARRELEEETGYRAGTVEERGDFHSSPGMTAERFTLVLASDLVRTGTGGGAGDEEITVHRVPLAQAAGFVAAKRREGLGIDAKLLLVLGGGLLAELGR